jgi:hypothetical protein
MFASAVTRAGVACVHLRFNARTGPAIVRKSPRAANAVTGGHR